MTPRMAMASISSIMLKAANRGGWRSDSGEWTGRAAPELLRIAAINNVGKAHLKAVRSEHIGKLTAAHNIVGEARILAGHFSAEGPLVITNQPVVPLLHDRPAQRQTNIV